MYLSQLTWAACLLPWWCPRLYLTLWVSLGARHPRNCWCRGLADLPLVKTNIRFVMFGIVWYVLKEWYKWWHYVVNMLWTFKMCKFHTKWYSGFLKTHLKCTNETVLLSKVRKSCLHSSTLTSQWRCRRALTGLTMSTSVSGVTPLTSALVTSTSQETFYCRPTL